MNDDLTPEEREALANLPRERTPSAGLEDRVVAAMRESGHLARKPARVIRLTTPRMAGLLAASLVLMIGAYSIGLHHGVDNEVLRNVAPQGTTMSGQGTRDEEVRLKPPVSTERVMSEPEALPEKDQAANEPTAPPLEWKLNTPKIAPTTDVKKEKQAKGDEVTESMTKSFSDRLSAESDQPAPAPAANSLAPSKQQMQVNESRMATQSSRTFALHGGTLIVDAPDSVRVVTDEQGRTLLIYTSNGVIRIRLAD